MIQERFSNIEKTHKLLEEFLRITEVTDEKEFNELLRKGEFLVEKNCLNTTSCIKLIIARSPMVLKPILLHSASMSATWDVFVKEAQNNLWIAFKTPSKEELIIENRNILNVKSSYQYTKKNHSNNQPNYKKMFCKIHGKCNHSTNKCRIILQLEEQGFKITKKSTETINQIVEENDNNENQLNKREFIYSVINCNKNPFTVNLKISHITHKGIIDTGADISLIHISNIPNKIKIFKENKTQKFTHSIYSACGKKISIIGKIELKVGINNKEFNMPFFVTDKNPKYTLIGTDNILKYPSLLSGILQNQIETKTINTIEKENDIVEKFKDIFKTEISDLNLCSGGTHTIHLTNKQPIKQKNTRIPINYEKEITKEIENNLKLGIIRESKSSWSSRVVPVPKPDGRIRLCIDYRSLNQRTIKDSYPLPCISEIIDSLGKAKIFSTLDATSGYYQIALEEESKPLTAFSWKGGLYEYNRLPFGLCNGPATFQRVIDTILKKELGKFVYAYLDDIIIYSQSKQEHDKHLQIVLSKLKASGLSLNKNKCKFYKKKIKILGYILSDGIVKPEPEKKQAVRDFEKPTTVKELRSFLGLANYCRDFIANFSEITAPLCDLLKGETKKSIKKIKWNDLTNKSFLETKKQIAEVSYRNQPDFDKEFIVTTDASNQAIEGILSQKNQFGKEVLIYAFSKKLDAAQKNYSITDKELLAVVKTLEHFRHYLLGKPFILKTDHKALEYIWSAQNMNSRLMRWSLKLQEYSFRVKYIRGECNIADSLTRSLSVLNIAQNPRLVKSITDTYVKKDIIREYHIATGHGSNSNMNFLIRKKYNWSGLSKDIQDYIKQCKICSLSGNELVNTKNSIIKTTRPNEIWEVDLIGRIQNKNKNKFIFMAIDHFTKWIETRVITQKDSNTIYKCIKELIINKHGVPNMILSDNGCEFINNKINQLKEEYNFEWSYNSPGHHQTMGAVERVNQTFLSKLKKLVNFNLNSWESKVEAATLATNISFNRSIGTSPMLIKFGKIPDLEVDKKLGAVGFTVPIEESIKIRNKNFDKYALKDIQKGNVMCKYNLKIGDKVSIFKKRLGNKLGTDWIDGYEIIKKIKPDAYVVKKGNSILRLNKIHVKKMEKRLVGEGDVANV